MPSSYAMLKILTRRYAQGAAEHGGECARTGIAQFPRDLADALAMGQAGQSFGQMDLLKPVTEMQAGFALEQSDKCP